MRLASILRDLALTALILMFIAIVAVKLEDSTARSMSGRPRIIDGDTLVLDGDRVRLSGIDAPEFHQVCDLKGVEWPCGRQAKEYLVALIGDAATMCKAEGSDRYGRVLGVCVARGQDLNAAMVSNGYAVAFGDYEIEEGLAQRRKIGLWAGTFDTPRNWRKSHGGIEEAPHIDGFWPVTVLGEIGNWLWEALSGMWNDRQS